MSTDATASRRWGRVGVGIAAPPTPAAVWRAELARLEAMPYGSMWINELIGDREVFSQLGMVLAATDRIVVGTGVAVMWARHGASMQAGAATLADAYPGRLALGLGVSSRSMAERAGHAYGKPLTEMRAYLDQMDAATGQAVRPAVPFPRLLGALGPRMLELARDRADGAYPHTMPVENTAQARRVLGPDKLLVTGVGVFLGDPGRAHAMLREHPLFRMPGSPYAAQLRRLGYAEEEITGEGAPSARIIDAVFACGDEAAVAARVREHLDAGADHVVVQPFGPSLPGLVDQLDRLAPYLAPIQAG
ncbi:putative F420-dependent oxidoreductase [Thermocatellispora tengchongensis]|uniref:Putative F420-dependent oxidoreductase n=1 Tax=Thermocatellispora tengchongensis TaxID=1073253 RepID=A0A840PKW2_9ACTN|nr:TIGR03620 family F420-dependent LLM class oxidoreductase [Thermocatellispora tengchongensis]MBB5139732.1 putative F420-dependent oxidoreductase [Thermocatellispora tengchongensis]